MTTKYPIYIPSKGRAQHCLTAQLFDRNKIDYQLVVEPQDVEGYGALFGADKVLSLPENGKGLVYSRNFIKDHSRSLGHERHWQFDDDISHFRRMFRGKRLVCHPRPALQAAEEFVDRYTNVALASFNSTFFVPATGLFAKEWPPFFLNARCYTCFLILNETPFRFRYRYNEDTDMTLQCLVGGWCTILFNAFLILTEATMTTQGGNTGIYVNDGRLRMARQLERVWPGVVETRRKFGRPQHHVKGLWNKFDTQLKLKDGVVLPTGNNEFGMKLVQRQQGSTHAIAQPSAEIRYPIFIPSKGRPQSTTARSLVEQNVAFRIVVEPQDEAAYRELWGDRVLVLPQNDYGHVAHARNYIQHFAHSEGAARHWQLDDDITATHLLVDLKPVKASWRELLSVCEAETDRYANVALSGPSYITWARMKKPDISVNGLCASAMLVHSASAYQWRDAIEDADYCFQLLSAGLCTLVFNRACITVPSPSGKTEQAQRLVDRWPSLPLKVKTTGTMIDCSRAWRLFRETPKLKLATCATTPSGV